MDLYKKLEGHSDKVYAVAWSPDGSMLASGGYKEILLWDVKSGERVGELGGA